jgi:valyl-tRNA synthetase
MDDQRLHEEASVLREAFWRLFCDRHLELIKGLGPAGDNPPATPLGASYAALRAAWRGYLALFAPF